MMGASALPTSTTSYLAKFGIGGSCLPRTFLPGQRVGILVGLQAVDGPSVAKVNGTGRVVRQVEFWKGQPEYIVHLDDQPADQEDLVYRPYLLVAL